MITELTYHGFGQADVFRRNGSGYAAASRSLGSYVGTNFTLYRIAMLTGYTHAQLILDKCLLCDMGIFVNELNRAGRL